MRLFDTALGRTGVAWRGDTVVAVQLPEIDDAATRRRLRSGLGAHGTTAHLDRHRPGATVEGDDADPETRPTVPGPGVAAAIDGMVRLLGGEPMDLGFVAVDLDRCSPFDRAVYDVTRAIPAGRSLTYGEVAERIGEPGAAQAVGRSLGANPIPIIVPCHRVLGAGGKLTGFSAAGGVVTKRRMLLIEGCPAVPPSLFD